MRYFCILSVLLAINLPAFLHSQENSGVIRTYLSANHSKFKVGESDLKEIQIVGTASSKARDVKHYYIRQVFQGIPVVNGLATVTMKGSEVVNVSSRLKANGKELNTISSVGVQQAIINLCESKSVKFSGELRQLENKENKLVFENAAISNQKILAEKVYCFTGNKMELSWDISWLEKSGQHWWSARVSAVTGEILEVNDWIMSCTFGEKCESGHLNHSTTKSAQQLLPPPPGADQYMVYALPLESPNHGNRSLVINPSDAINSPYGWHDTDGNAGDEFTITRGNNVWATEDIDNDDEAGYSPNGGSALNFNFAYDSLTGVQGNLDAVITNLFYMNNMMHDIWYHYGFDEESGNFQQTNYSGLGLGEDFVFAQAQDGSGTNNANFGTPPEGMSPSMQMYLWSEVTTEGTLTVNSPSAIAGDYLSAAASFGPPIPTTPITEDVILVNDGVGTTSDGCQTIQNAAQLAGKIALVKRGGCPFGQKIELCEAAGAVAVIVANNAAGAPFAMNGESEADIPAIMISQANGNLFETTMQTDTVNATLVKMPDLSAFDSDFDNGIIAHEYGHGISTRLTGGGDNSDCLWNDEQMGEGWSDWFAMMVTMKAGDLPESPRGVGTYVIGEPTNGAGIRPAPYTTSFSINPYTYISTNSNAQTSQPHGIGFVWATMLWDLNWALIDQYGFDANVKTGNGGNNIAMSLVIEGLKLQPCSPGFVDGRDAILLADELLYNGANKCLIWEVFARRGLGFSADQGSSESRTDQTQAFDLHPSCIESGLGLFEKTLDMVQVYPNPATTELTIDMSNYSEVSSIRVVDIQGKVLYENSDVEVITKIDVSHWKSGMYLVNLKDANGAKSVQIMRR